MARATSEHLYTCRPCGVREHTMRERWFPTPATASLPGAGIDISDSSVKWLSLAPAERGWRVAQYGQTFLPEGVVVNGVVQDVGKLATALTTLRKESGIVRAHAALPEERAYVFSMQAPDISDHEQVLRMVEFELEGRVPIRAGQAVYDYDIVAGTYSGSGAEIGVTVFPSDTAEGYIEAFKQSGIQLLSLELEARSLARAAMPDGSSDAILLADFGRARTGFAVLRGQVPIFTTTVDVGGATLTSIIQRELSVSEEEAEEFKNEYGIIKGDNTKLYEVVMGTAATLADEIARHYQYWDTRRNEHGERVTPVARVMLAGGSANLKGLGEYVASRVQAPTEVIDVWSNICSYEDYIPPIDRHHSLGYATAIGLALRSV